jgi:DNA-3-methyladenine glycosylase II
MSEEIIAHLTRADPVLGAVIRAVGPLRFELRTDGEPFQTLTHAIAHQQLNGMAANTILRRLVESCGEGSFPTPQAILDASTATLRAAGFSFGKIAALKDLAAKTLEAVVPDLGTLGTLGDEAIIERLTQVRGIGRWTVEMLLMFHLGREDVLPVDDFGVRSGFRAAYGLKKAPHPKQLALWGERWRPYRSAAAWYLWRAIELHKAGTLPAPMERVRLPRLKRKRRGKAGKIAAGGLARRSRRKSLRQASPRSARLLKRSGLRRVAPRLSAAATKALSGKIAAGDFAQSTKPAKASAASSARPRRSGARSGSRPRPARRPRAPAKKK